jgi:hypothetical protein
MNYYRTLTVAINLVNNVAVNNSGYIHTVLQNIQGEKEAFEYVKGIVQRSVGSATVCSNNPYCYTGGPQVFFLLTLKGTPSSKKHKIISRGLSKINRLCLVMDPMAFFTVSLPE